MNKTFNKVFQNSILFTLGIIATKAISFFMLPIYTHYMTDTEYGMASTVMSFINTFSLIVLLGLRAAVLRFYPGLKSDEKKKQFAGNVYLVIFANIILVTFLALTFKDYLIKYLFPGMVFFPLIFLGVVGLGAEAIYLAYQSFLQAEQKGKEYSINSVCYMLLYTGTNLILIAGFKLGVLGMTITMVTTPLIMGIIGIIRSYHQDRIEFRFDHSIVIPTLKYALPIVPHDASGMISMHISKVFINTAVSYQATGQYTVASQISSIMSLVQGSLNMAFHPWFNEQMQQGAEGRKNIKKFSLLIFAIYCYASIMIAFFSPELICILTPDAYRDAWQLVPLLTLALVVHFIYYTHVLTIFYNVKASKFISVCSITGSLMDIILSYFLINHMASFGAAIAYFLARCITTLITVLYSRKVERVDFGLPKMCLMTIGTAGIMALGLVYGYVNQINEFNLINILIKLAVAIGLTLLILAIYRKEIVSHVGVLLKRKGDR